MITFPGSSTNFPLFLSFEYIFHTSSFDYNVLFSSIILEDFISHPCFPVFVKRSLIVCIAFIWFICSIFNILEIGSSSYFAYYCLVSLKSYLWGVLCFLQLGTQHQSMLFFTTISVVFFYNIQYIWFFSVISRYSLLEERSYYVYQYVNESLYYKFILVTVK